MDPYSSQRQSNIRCLENLQLAQGEIIRLNTVVSRLEADAAVERVNSELNSKIKLELEKRTVALRADLVTVKNEFRMSMESVALFFSEGLTTAARSARAQENVLVRLREESTRAMMVEDGLRRDNKAMTVRLDQMKDYVALKGETKSAQAELDRCRINAKEASEVVKRLENELADATKAATSDRARDKSFKDKLEVRVKETQIAMEDLSREHADTLAQLQKRYDEGTREYELKILEQSVTISRLTEERNELMRMLQGGTRFAEFVHLRTENAELHARVNDLQLNKSGVIGVKQLPRGKLTSAVFLRVAPPKLTSQSDSADSGDADRSDNRAIEQRANGPRKRSSLPAVASSQPTAYIQPVNLSISGGSLAATGSSTAKPASVQKEPGGKSRLQRASAYREVSPKITLQKESANSARDMDDEDSYEDDARRDSIATESSGAGIVEGVTEYVPRR